MRFFKSTPTFDFFSKRFLFITLSGILCTASIALILFKGFNLGIDFKGGTNIQVQFTDEKSVAEVRRVMEEAVNVQPVVLVFGVAANNELLIQFPGQDNEVANETLLKKATGKIKASYPNAEIRQIETIGPKVGSELKTGALYAVLISLLVTVIYISIRFKYFYAIGAWLALLHDTLLTLGILILLGYEFNLTILAAILTVNGYSMNDTIVVYDRIRENVGKYSDSFGNIINRSINQTLSRTLITSVTTLFPMLFLFIFGGESIKGFAFTIVFGIFVGTYSSIFIASPVLFYFNKQHLGNESEEIIETKTVATGN